MFCCSSQDSYYRTSKEGSEQFGFHSMIRKKKQNNIFEWYDQLLDNLQNCEQYKWAQQLYKQLQDKEIQMKIKSNYQQDLHYFNVFLGLQEIEIQTQFDTQQLKNSSQLLFETPTMSSKYPGITQSNPFHEIVGNTIIFQEDINLAVSQIRISQNIIKKTQNEYASFYSKNSIISNQEMTNEDLLNGIQMVSIFKSIFGYIDIQMQNKKNILGQILKKFQRKLKENYKNCEHSIIQQIKDFNDILTRTLVSYYQMQDFQNNVNGGLFSYDNIYNFLMNILFDQEIYMIVCDIYIKSNFNQINNLQNKMMFLQDFPPQYFHISDKYCLNELTMGYFYEFEIDKQYEPYKNCIEQLRDINKAQSPILKLKMIEKQIVMIYQEINQFYLNLNKKQNVKLDSDELMNIIVYITIRSQVYNLLVDLRISENFLTQNFCNSQASYQRTNFEAAVQYIIEKDWNDEQN